MPAPRISATLARDEHADAVAAFYREVWDREATAESVLSATRRARQENLSQPGVAPPIALVFAGERVVGYCGSIPQRLWDGAAQRPAYWVKGLMVLPEFRNGPIGYLAVKELSRHLDCSTILVVAPAARRLFAAMGYSDLGAVSNWIRPLRPRAIAERVDLQTIGLLSPGAWVTRAAHAAQSSGVLALGAAAAGVALDSFARAGRFSVANLQTHPDDSIADGELDELWAAARIGIAASPVRDSSYIVPRFGNRQESKGDETSYIRVATRDRGRLVGFAAVRKPRSESDSRLAGIRVATVSELLYSPRRSDAGLATLGEIERVARRTGADAVTCMTSHPAVSSLLRRQAYLRLPGNVHFMLRDVTGSGRWPLQVSAWWLGRGDGESDTSF